MLFNGFVNLFIAFGLLASALLGSVVALLAVRSKITLHIAITSAIAGDAGVIASAFITSKLAWCSEYVNDICVDPQISPFQRQVADHAMLIIYGTVVPVSALTAILLARRKNMSRSNGDPSIV
jgi:hypothetical protein